MGARAIVEHGGFIDFSAPDIWHIAGYMAAACDPNVGSSIPTIVQADTAQAAYVVDSSTWPYDVDGGPDCPAAINRVPSNAVLAQGGLAFIEQSTPVNPRDLDGIKDAIAQGWPPVIGVEVWGTCGDPGCSSCTSWWTTPDIDVPGPTDVFCGGHAVMLTSYDDTTSTVGFVNSWGDEWGENGFGTFTYAFLARRSTGGYALQQLSYTGEANTCPVDYCSSNQLAAGSYCEGSAPGSQVVTCVDAGACVEVTGEPTTCTYGCSDGQCTSSPTCPGVGGACSNHGTCSGVTCDCDTGYQSPDCSSCATGYASCGEVCTTLADDPANCGSCGHNCEQGACVASACQAFALASAAGPLAITVDASNVYWIDTNDVMKVPIGGGSATPLATQSMYSNLNGISVQNDNVYWTSGNVSNLGQGTITMVPIGGGTPHTLISGLSLPYCLTTDMNSVYWAEGASPGRVAKMPLGGGPVTSLAPGQDIPAAIAVDPHNVYWIDEISEQQSSTVMQVPINGGTPVTLASGQDGMYGIALDATSVYWTNYNPGTVVKVPIGGGPVTTLAMEQNSPQGIAVDSSGVYWTNFTGSSVATVPVGGGAFKTLASGQTNACCITTDATAVYWATDNAIMKVVK